MPLVVLCVVVKALRSLLIEQRELRKTTGNGIAIASARAMAVRSGDDGCEGKGWAATDLDDDDGEDEGKGRAAAEDAI